MDPMYRYDMESGGGVPQPETTKGADYSALAGVTSTLTQITAAVGSAYDTYAQIRALKLQGKAERSRARFNARLMDLAAQDARRRGELAAGRIRLAGRAMEATQRARMAAGGVSVSGGSAADILADTRLFTEFDMAQVKSNAAREAWGYETRGGQIRSNIEWQRLATRGRQDYTLLTGGARTMQELNRVRWADPSVQ